jgi:hypothetical protein
MSQVPMKDRHGMSRSPEYKAWQGLLDRCCNPNSQRWHRYGARGVTVCNRWRDSFQAFIDDVGPRPSKDHSIDRIDNDGNYEPGNCKWSTKEEQARNKETNFVFEFRGRKMLLTDWAKEAGINFYTLRQRVVNGWPEDKVFAAAGSARMGVDREVVERPRRNRAGSASKFFGENGEQN